MVVLVQMVAGIGDGDGQSGGWATVWSCALLCDENEWTTRLGGFQWPSGSLCNNTRTLGAWHRCVQRPWRLAALGLVGMQLAEEIDGLKNKEGAGAHNDLAGINRRLGEGQTMANLGRWPAGRGGRDCFDGGVAGHPRS